MLRCPRSLFRAPRLAPCLGAVAGLALSACAHHPPPLPDASESPEAYLERQLLGRNEGQANTPTADGGMLFHAEFGADRRSSLRIPFDVLKSYCESKAGRWVASGAPTTSSQRLAASRAPNDVVAVLADAENRGLFGRYRCESTSAPTWTARIEPSDLSLTSAPGVWLLELFLKAYIGSDLSQGGELAPPLAAGAQAPTAPPPSAAPEGSPLNLHTLRPPTGGELLLADPRPFGIDMGSDSPDVFAAKLRIDGAGTPCPAAPASPPAAKPEKKAKAPESPAAPALSELCWQRPGAGEALALHARFADLGHGPVVAEFEVRYPAESFVWLEHGMRNDWGPPDVHADRSTWHAWSWLHTVIELAHAEDNPAHETLVRVQHRPTLARAQLAPGTPGREQPGPVRVAEPWQLQLGYEPAQQAQAKLQAAGLTIAASGCIDAGQRALPVSTRVCPLTGSSMDGLRSAQVITVDIGDGRPKLAKLEYTFDKRVLDATVAELRIQYGNPIPVAGNALQWWTGPVGIEVVPNQDSFTLRYFHGRLLQFHINAVERNQAGDKALQQQGL
jgi:hypothetical protein